MFWYEWSENHNFSPIQSQTSQKKKATHKSSPLSKYDTRASPRYVCAPLLSSLRRAISRGLRELFFCVSDLVNRLSIYDEEGSHNTRYSLIFVPHFRWIFFLLSFRQHNTELDFSQKSEKLSFFTVKYFLSQLFIPRNWTKLGKILVFCLERGATPESWSVIVGSIYNNETY